MALLRSRRFPISDHTFEVFSTPFFLQFLFVVANVVSLRCAYLRGVFAAYPATLFLLWGFGYNRLLFWRRFLFHWITGARFLRLRLGLGQPFLLLLFLGLLKPLHKVIDHVAHRLEVVHRLPGVLRLGVA